MGEVVYCKALTKEVINALREHVLPHKDVVVCFQVLYVFPKSFDDYSDPVGVCTCVYKFGVETWGINAHICGSSIWHMQSLVPPHGICDYSSRGSLPLSDVALDARENYTHTPTYVYPLLFSV